MATFNKLKPYGGESLKRSNGFLIDQFTKKSGSLIDNLKF